MAHKQRPVIMTIQPFYTHAERYAAQGVYDQLKNKEKTIGLSEHEIGERDIMRERLRLPVPENWVTTKHGEYTIRVHKDLLNIVGDCKPIGFSDPVIVLPTQKSSEDGEDWRLLKGCENLSFFDLMFENKEGGDLLKAAKEKLIQEEGYVEGFNFPSVCNTEMIFKG